ncbi:MAG: phenylacetate--CoA ligase family protein [Candidatus Latescibacteria bacterium]|nr:phenylacetate--CoA ligase family protein [Candidatus Latescibacterota bacterium]
MTVFIKNIFSQRKLKEIHGYLSFQYKKTTNLIKKTEYLSKEELQLLQFNKVKNRLIHAYKNVPYYSDSFRKINFDPNEMHSLDELQRIPFLSKEEYRSNIDKFISKNMPKRLLLKRYTGGTTGEPTPLYRNISDYGREKAFTDYAYSMLGVKPNCRAAFLRDAVNDNNRHYIVNKFDRTLYLSGHHLTEDDLDVYINKIREYHPQLYWVLSSSALILADYMKRTNEKAFEGIKVVLCTSETLYDFQKKRMEEAFGAKIASHYGHSEHAVIALCCKHSNLFHVIPQYGYTELIDQNGNVVTHEGEIGDIVGTSFTNKSCPLIRYRTGDRARLTFTKCPCGRNYVMWDLIEGRKPAMAMAKNGSAVSIGPQLLCTIHDDTYGKIKQFRFEQYEKGKLDIIVTLLNNSFLTTTNRYFTDLFEKHYPGLFEINVKLSSDQKDKSKHLYFKQHLNVD